jgi:hypothetical protein
MVSILGMVIVDSWLTFDGCMKRMEDFGREKQSKFYELLIEELINNSYNPVRTCVRRADEPNDGVKNQLLSPPIRVTPTQRGDTKI